MPGSGNRGRSNPPRPFPEYCWWWSGNPCNPSFGTPCFVHHVNHCTGRYRYGNHFSDSSHRMITHDQIGFLLVKVKVRGRIIVCTLPRIIVEDAAAKIERTFQTFARTILQPHHIGFFLARDHSVTHSLVLLG